MWQFMLSKLCLSQRNHGHLCLLPGKHVLGSWPGDFQLKKNQLSQPGQIDTAGVCLSSFLSVYMEELSLNGTLFKGLGKAEKKVCEFVCVCVCAVSLLHSLTRCALGPSMVTVCLCVQYQFSAVASIAKGLSYATSLALADYRDPYG